MFVDSAKIYVKAGNGGNGAVAFRREKYVPAGGPEGGDGGNGGNIILIADANLRTLMDFKYKQRYLAPKGEDGKGSNRYGKAGEDLILRVPVGTVVRDARTHGVLFDLKHNREEVILAKGGRGGKGNTHFKNSVRQAPAFAKAGKDGQEREIILELMLLADVGLIGYPNVGKSTFLSIATKANPKIANYHFTTLTPNLGVVAMGDGDSYVMADIPGLIEGASEGVGLGHDFLRHVERTKLLLHIVDISGLEGRDPVEDVHRINHELESYNPKLAHKKQIIVANKMDLLRDPSVYEDFKQSMEAEGYGVYAMSGATTQGVQEILKEVGYQLKELEDEALFEPEDMYVEYVALDQEDKEIRIHKEDDAYVVEGPYIEKLLYSVNFEDMESIRYFQRMLEEKGIFAKLREMGIQDGDPVRIYDLEFEFYD